MCSAMRKHEREPPRDLHSPKHPAFVAVEAFQTVFLAGFAVDCLGDCGFCFYQELAALGSEWTPDVSRALEMGTEGEFFERVRGATYVFYGPEGEAYAVEAGAVF